MHYRSDSIEVLINTKADRVIEENFQSLLSRCQIGLETLIKRSEIVFDCVHLLY